MGEVIADAQLEGDEGRGLRRCRGRVHESRRRPGDLVFNQISGGEQPGEVTYGEMFAVQPFSNTLVVKTCTGAQIDTILEQQFTAARQLDAAGLRTASVTRGAWRHRSGARCDPASIKIDGVDGRQPAA